MTKRTRTGELVNKTIVYSADHRIDLAQMAPWLWFDTGTQVWPGQGQADGHSRGTGCLRFDVLSTLRYDLQIVGMVKSEQDTIGS